MKKRDLETILATLAKNAGLEFKSIGGTKHDKFLLGTSVILVPRHREINELTAKAIIKQAEKIVLKGGE